MATNGADSIQFIGSLQYVTLTLTNAYSGYTITVNDIKRMNGSSYDGLGGYDILNMTNEGDVLILDDGSGSPRILNVEYINAGDGGDVLDMTSLQYVLGNMILSGSHGDDVIWANAGDDELHGSRGDDILDGGPGHDYLNGGRDNDILNGGDGNDVLVGDMGHDILMGDAGNDIFRYDTTDFGHDIIIETASADMNIIEFTTAVRLPDIAFDFQGNDLILSVGTQGSITIQGQFDGGGAGIDAITFSDGYSFDLRSVVKPNQAPVAVDDEFEGGEDAPVTGNVLANDSDADGGVLSVVAGIYTTAHGGVVSLLENGDFIYTPAADYHGADGFAYTVLDGQGGSATGNVTLNIADVVDAVSTNLDIRVSHGNTATRYINSADGYDITTASGFGTAETLDAGTLDIGGVAANAQVSYVFHDENSASVALDSAWNSLKNIEVYSATHGSITLGNFVHTDVHLGDGGDSVVTIHDAKRGFISTGDGDDHITIDALTNNQHWSNTFDIKTGAGHDSVTFSGDKGITLTTIDTGMGDDIVTLSGHYKAAEVFLGDGNDTLSGGNGADTIYGGAGNDTIQGGAGNDVLYGGNNDALLVQDKVFSDDVMFPQLQERKNIKDLSPSGESSLGVKDPNLHADFAGSATITFKNGYAGYNNSLGIYSIAADGTIQMASLLWENVKTAGFNITHEIDLPVGEEGGYYGFFIIADGDNVNHGYNGLDTGAAGNIRFVYDLGGADERAATIYDNGAHISIVYDDGAASRVLSGNVYHTTDRDGVSELNADGKIHTVSGQAEYGDGNVLAVGFEDLWNLGDGDYEDVYFELDIKAVVIDTSDQGHDILDGGAGNDILYGEGGDDVLIGGAGNDTLYGGTGADRFVFDTFDGIDRVKDFSVTEGDTLDISQILSGYDAGDDLGDFVSLISSGADTIVAVNASGDGAGYQSVAVLEGVNLTGGLELLVQNGTLIVGQDAVI